MFRFRKLRQYLLCSTAFSALWVCGRADAQPPEPEPHLDPDLLLVQAPFQPPVVLPPTLPGLDTTTPGAGPVIPGLTTPLPGEGPTRAPTSAGDSVVAGGAAAQVAGASDPASLLSSSTAATGVEVQQRNPVSGDPRIRGYRVGQVVTYGDGGFFLPARLDLDTAISKFDPSSIQDIAIIKGPYSVRYGPGSSFIDIVSLDTPRYDSFDVRGRTSFGPQFNGERLSFFQGVSGGNDTWGFRLGYDFRVGNDYEAGDGSNIPGSYNSQVFTAGLGYSFTDDARLEFKVLRQVQQNVEFPGLYFDIRRLDTEAYSLRFSANNQDGWFDRFNADLWYNYTGADGDTRQGAKQRFLSFFLSSAVNFGTPVTDFSTTSFTERSLGYRVYMGWGEQNCTQVTLGTDLSYVNQKLFENIRVLPTTPALISPTVGIPDPITGLLTQNLGIPDSHLVNPGLFLDATIPVDKRVTLNAGVRADYVYTTADNRFVNGNVVITPSAPPVVGAPAAGPVTSFDPIVFSQRPFPGSGQERHFDLWSGYVTADYKMNENITLFAKAGYAERYPTLTELYATGPFVAVLQQGLNRLFGDPNLDEEHIRQIDLGFTANYEFMRAGVTGFYSWIDNYITYNQNKAPTAGLAGGGAQAISQVIYTNTDEATLAGGEMYLEVDVLPMLTPFLTVSYVQGRDLTHVDNRLDPTLLSSRRTLDTEPLPGIPPLELRSGFRFHEGTRTPRWSVEVQARSIMGQNNVATSLSELPTSGFTIVDVRGYWKVNDMLLLSGGIENLGDKFYREHLDPISGFPGNQLYRIGTNVYLAAQLTY